MVHQTTSFTHKNLTMQPILNLDALNNLEQLLPSQDGQFFYLKASELPTNAATVIRILFPKPMHATEKGGLWFCYTSEHWFKLQGRENKIKAISSETFEGVSTCFIENVKSQLATNPQAVSLFANRDNYQKQSSFHFPCLVLDNIKTNNQGGIESYTVRNNKVCILSVPKSLLQEINGFFLSPFRQRPSGKAIADIEQGCSIAITKSEQGTGNKKRTTYKADCLPVPNAIEAKWEEGIDLEVMYKKQIFSDKYLESVFNHFLTGRGLMETPEYRYPALREQSANQPTGAPLFQPMQIPTQPVQNVQPTAPLFNVPVENTPEPVQPVSATPQEATPVVSDAPVVEEPKVETKVEPTVFEYTAPVVTANPATTMNQGAPVGDLLSMLKGSGQ